MEQNGTPDTTSLTARQEAAMPYLVASPSQSDGARVANIGRTTLHRWMQDDRFREELERLRAEAAGLAHTELNGLMLKGVLALAEALEDENPYIRLRAAQATLSIGLKALDLKELLRRLDRLDDAFALRRSSNPGR